MKGSVHTHLAQLFCFLFLPLSIFASPKTEICTGGSILFETATIMIRTNTDLHLDTGKIGLLESTSSISRGSSIPETEEELLKRLEYLEKEIHKITLTLLNLLRSIQDDDATIGTGSAVSKAKTIEEGSGVHETVVESSRIIYTASMHEEFDVLEIRDQMIRIRLQDGREGWIEETACNTCRSETRNASNG